MDAKTLKAAVRIANSEDFQGVDKGQNLGFRAGFKNNTEYTAAAREIALPDGVVGMGLMGGMQNMIYFRVARQPLSQSQACRFLLAKPRHHRAKAAQDLIRIIGRGGIAEIFCRLRHLVSQFLRPANRRAVHNIAMATEIFRRCVAANINAELLAG